MSRYVDLEAACRAICGRCQEAAGPPAKDGFTMLPAEQRRGSWYHAVEGVYGIYACDAFALRDLPTVDVDVDALRAEIARLREALLDIREIAAKSSAGPCPSIVRIVNAALAPKKPVHGVTPEMEDRIGCAALAPKEDTDE